MNFKFLRGKDPEIRFLQNETFLVQPILSFDRHNVEFCFQFDDNDPVHLGSGENNLHLVITPTPNGNIIFNDNGRTFKIFAREINQGGERA